MKHPCTECVTRPICRQKRYIHVFQDCSIMYSRMPSYDIADPKRENELIELYRQLKPTGWHVVKEIVPKHLYGNVNEDVIGYEECLRVNERIYRNGKFEYPYKNLEKAE